MTDNKTVQQILIHAIHLAGGDGLLNRAGKCACLKSDLAPCDRLSVDCRVGYLRICACGDWFLVADRSAATDRCPICRED